jgi:hypothetical protein
MGVRGFLREGYAEKVKNKNTVMWNGIRFGRREMQIKQKIKNKINLSYNYTPLFKLKAI